MTGDSGKTTATNRGEREAARRAERSRAALRENLKRRKAQAKARRQDSGNFGGSREFAPEKPEG